MAARGSAGGGVNRPRAAVAGALAGARRWRLLRLPVPVVAPWSGPSADLRSAAPPAERPAGLETGPNPEMPP